MKHLIAFHATEVYTHLGMDIEFFPDLTFLYGLNGSGKTTALRLIMGLLTPSVETLGSISFKTATISGDSHKHGKVVISATRTDTHLELSCSACSDKLSIPLDWLDKEDSEMMVNRECSRSKTFELIKDIASPMFLGIDRRFITPETKRRPPSMVSSREMASRFRWERLASEEHSYDRGLAEVADLIDTNVARLQAIQERVNERFRKDILLESFAYVDQSTFGISLATPTEEEFSDFQKKRLAISKALAGLGLASEEFEEKSEKFFNTIENIITVIRQSAGKATKAKGMSKELSEALTAWFVNQFQMERINRLFDMATKYQEQTAATDKPLSDFMGLVNQFFCQTGKEFVIGREGGVRIKTSKGNSTPLNALSSGERQIFIMLAHLSLNRRLLRDGVLIIDEPELSLHMGWQDMFVDAIQKANPRLQLILATHAPAIIGGRNSLCVPVSLTEGE